MSDDPCDGCVELNNKARLITCYIKDKGCVDGCPCANCLIKCICSVHCKEHLNYYVNTYEITKKRKLEEKQHET